MASTTMYYYTKVMSDLFLDSSSTGGKSFRAITSVDDFWKVKYYSFSSLLATSGMAVPQLTDFGVLEMDISIWDEWSLLNFF